MSDLSHWCLAHYQALKDFAGPVATVIAAGVAVFVTWRLGYRQSCIAEQQARIAAQQASTAFDRLRLDLFEKRYAVLKAAMRIGQDITVRAAIAAPTEPPVPDSDLLILEEAHLLLPPEICNVLDQIRADAEGINRLVTRRATQRDDHRQGLEHAIFSIGRRLRMRTMALPQLFQPVLGFSRVADVETVGTGGLRESNGLGPLYLGSQSMVPLTLRAPWRYTPKRR